MRKPVHHEPPESVKVNDRLEKVINDPEIAHAPAKEPSPDETAHHAKYSPSGIERIAACPASVRMSQGLPALPASEDASEGTRLHKAVSTGNKAGLDFEQLDLVNRCIDLVSELAGNDGQILHEEKLTLLGSNFEELTFGTCDVRIQKPDRVILIDWKFGRNEVEEAANNLQLAVYAIGAAQRYGIDKVECHVFQPRINHHSVYTFTDMPAVLASIEAVIAKSNAPEWTFSPSEKTCQYCRAKFTCAPCLKALQNPPVVFDDEKQEALAVRMPELIRAAKQAAKISEAILDKAKDLLTQGITVPGYFLKPGNEVRKVTDIAKAYDLIKDLISYEDYLKLCNVPPAKLEEIFVQALRTAKPETTKKDAEAEFSEIMRAVIYKSRNAPSLAEVKS